MKKEKIIESKIVGFKRSNIKLVEDIIKYFIKKSIHLDTEILNENKGYYEKRSLKTLFLELTKTSKYYTGLDEIIIKEKNCELIVIIFHEDLFILNVDEETKKEIETKFNIKIVPLEIN